MTTAHTAMPRIKRWTDAKLEKEIVFAGADLYTLEGIKWAEMLQAERDRRAALAKAKGQP
jgi:hypothetical protein